MRAKGAVYSEIINDVFEWMAHRQALRAMAAKRAAKKAKKAGRRK